MLNESKIKSNHIISINDYQTIVKNRLYTADNNLILRLDVEKKILIITPVF